MDWPIIAPVVSDPTLRLQCCGRPMEPMGDDGCLSTELGTVCLRPPCRAPSYKTCIHLRVVQQVGQTTAVRGQRAPSLCDSSVDCCTGCAVVPPLGSASTQQGIRSRSEQLSVAQLYL